MKNQQIQKDTKKRAIFAKSELKQLLLKALTNNTIITNKLRLQAATKLGPLSKNSSAVRIKNRCILTGRSKAVYRQFKLSRLMLRALASNGHIAGVRKASW